MTGVFVRMSPSSTPRTPARMDSTTNSETRNCTSARRRSSASCRRIGTLAQSAVHLRRHGAPLAPLDHIDAGAGSVGIQPILDYSHRSRVRRHTT